MDLIRLISQILVIAKADKNLVGENYPEVFLTEVTKSSYVKYLTKYGEPKKGFEGSKEWAESFAEALNQGVTIMFSELGSLLNEEQKTEIHKTLVEFLSEDENGSKN